VDRIRYFYETMNGKEEINITGQRSPFHEELEQKLALLIINTEEPFVLVDPELNIVTFNQQFEQNYFNYFGIKIVKGISILNFAQQSTVTALRGIYKNALKGISHQSELKVDAADSSPHIFLLKYKPAFDETGQIVGVFVSSTEITEIKKSQELLIASENRFRSLINNANDMILLTDKEGKVSYVSPALERITGYSFAELCDRSIFSIMHPDQVGTSRKVLEKILNNPGVVVPKLNQFHHKKGHYVWVEGTVTNLLHDPAVGAIVANYHDITHRKEAEERLRRNEERLKVIIDNEPECVKIVDLSGTLLEMNEAGVKMLEADSQEQLIGQPILKLIHPEDRDLYHGLHEKCCIGERGTASFRVCSIKKNTMWMETHSVPLRNSNGDIYAVLSVTRDVTEKKNAQELLEKNEKRYRALVENAGDAIAIVRPDGRSNYVSPSVKKIMGYTEEEALELNMFDVIHPDDIAGVRTLLKKALENPRVTIKGHTGRVMHKDGTWRWCESVITNLLDDPHINGIVTNFRDVTEKILAEKEKEFDHSNLHALINNTNDLIWSISIDGKLISSNRAFDEMVKYMSGNEVVKGGDAPKAGFPEEQLKKWEALYARAFAGEEFTIIEYTNFQEEYWSEISFYPIKQGDKIIGIACYSRNITERKHFERKLEENTAEVLAIKKELEYNTSRLKQAQGVAHVGNWEMSFETNTSKWSDEAYRIYGLEPADHKLTPEDWKTFIHPEDLGGFLQEMQRARETLSDSRFLHRIVRRDGSVRHIISQSRFDFNEAGVPIGMYGTTHDVTDQVEAEENLKKSHELLQKLTDKVPVPVYQFEMDLEGRMAFPFISKAITQLVPDADIESLRSDAMPIFKAVHPEDISMLFASIQESKNTLNDWSIEFRMQPKNDIIRWLYGFSKPELKENGVVVWYGYLKDITERKLAEEQIRMAKERYDLLTKATNDAIWDWDITTGKLYWGEGFRTLFGYNHKNGNIHLNSWTDHIHRDDKERVLENMQKTIYSEKEVQWQDEYRYIKSDGSFTDVLDRGYIIRNSEGAPIRMIGAMEDISLRKLAAEEIRVAKERYDLVTKATNDSIYDWDLVNNKIVRTGDGLTIFFGYSDQDVSDDPDFWRNKMHPEEVEECYNKLNAYLEDPTKNLCDMEYRFRRADNTYAFVYDKGYIVRNAGGKAVRLLGATRDISDRKEKELLLKELNEQLEKRAEELAVSNSELEQFAYIASHDLQEPLRMVTSFLTQLENKYKNQLDDKAKQYIYFATDGAIRMRRLILDLLEYSRVGRHPNIKAEVDANELVYEAVRLNKSAIDESKAVINCKNLPIINGSKTTLIQVFQNLISNAIKYYTAGERPIINIAASETPSHWKFEVSDNGIGIEERYFEKIFIVFQRLHSKDEFSGTGIGLAICRKIVENHQGTIWVESEYGKGSTFLFTIAKPDH